MWWQKVYNPSIGETEAGRPWVRGQPGLHGQTISQQPENLACVFPALSGCLCSSPVHMFGREFIYFKKKLNSPLKPQAHHRQKPTVRCLERLYTHLKITLIQVMPPSTPVAACAFVLENLLMGCTVGGASPWALHRKWPRGWDPHTTSRAPSGDTHRDRGPCFSSSNVNLASTLFVCWMP